MRSLLGPCLILASLSLAPTGSASVPISGPYVQQRNEAFDWSQENEDAGRASALERAARVRTLWLEPPLPPPELPAPPPIPAPDAGPIPAPIAGPIAEPDAHEVAKVDVSAPGQPAEPRPLPTSSWADGLAIRVGALRTWLARSGPTEPEETPPSSAPPTLAYWIERAWEQAAGWKPAPNPTALASKAPGPSPESPEPSAPTAPPPSPLTGPLVHPKVDPPRQASLPAQPSVRRPATVSPSAEPPPQATGQPESVAPSPVAAEVRKNRPARVARARPPTVPTRRQTPPSIRKPETVGEAQKPKSRTVVRVTPRDDPPTIARVTPRDDPPTIARVTPRDDPPTAVRKARYRGRPTASRKARRAVSQRGQGQRRAPEPWRLESRRRARAELARLEANIREFEASQPEPAKAVLEAHEPAHWHHHAGDDVWCDEEHSGDEEVHVYRSCDAWGCRVDEVVVLRVE